ncbi:hypothetical protein LTR08_005955 [Meristemomyces frigidus]|nr:hypothetical protein LTR08_005955 [Meristemomyces frigidus]
MDKQFLATYFLGCGYLEVGHLLRDSISGTQKPVLSKTSQDWIMEKRLEYQEPLAIAPLQATSQAFDTDIPMEGTGSTASEPSSPLFEPGEPTGHQATGGIDSTAAVEETHTNRSLPTDFGNVIGVSTVGRGYRAIVNIGTDRCEIFTCMPGSKFGRNMGAALYDQKPLPPPVKLAGRTPKHIEEITAIVEVPTKKADPKREPITYLRVAWSQDLQKNPLANMAPPTEWITRSNAISLCGKKCVEGYRARLLKLRGEMEEWIEECKAQSLEPDTGVPITEARKLELRWLFPGQSFTEDSSNAPSRDDSEAANIKIGNGWKKPNPTS